MDNQTPQFAQIPFEIICRFGELSKVEIVVFSNLMAHKNQATGLCNPKPILIANETGIDKGNVSKAIKNLESKGWLIWQKNGEFLFPVLGEKVVNLTTSEDPETNKKLLIQQPKVVNSTTQVVNLTTLLNKEFKHKNNIKENIKEREVASAPPPSKKGTRLSDPFYLTTDMKTWALENCPGVNLITETAAFTDHFRSAPGSKGIKLDWVATWRNWIRREYKTISKNGGQNNAKNNSFGKFDKNAKFDANLDELANDPAFGFATG